MKRKLLVIVSAAAIVLATAILAVNLNSYYPFWKLFKRQYPLSYYKGDYGTAENLDGKTLCVSMFVNAETGSWTEHDDLKDQSREKLGMAASWITENAAAYGKNAEFIWDWEQSPELYYEVNNKHIQMGDWLCENDGYNFLWDFMNNDIPTKKLLEQFGAENIIYIAFFRMPENNAQTAFSLDCYYNKSFSYDMICMPEYINGREMSATIIAHEMLHSFGAPDLYRTGEKGTLQCGIGSEALDSFRQTYPDEIMLRTYDHETDTAFYGEVNGMLSPITAYYTGLTDEVPQAVMDFGLDLSSHDPNRVQ